jgi:hypothetical protein
MKYIPINLFIRIFILLLVFPGSVFSQSSGMSRITERELRYHLEFLGSREFRGRETPSPELDIATLYVANWARDAGLKPLMPDGSFFQPVPVTVTSVFQPGTKITFTKGGNQKIWYYGRDFGGAFATSGSYSGKVVFAGFGAITQGTGEDYLRGVDLTGKIVVILDELLPGQTLPTGPYYYYRLNTVISALQEKGASAVLSVVSPEREDRFRAGSNIFDRLPSGRMGVIYDSQRTDFEGHEKSRVTKAPFEKAEISHEVAAELFGLKVDNIREMFEKARKGETISPFESGPAVVQLDVATETKMAFSRNVIALVEGSDPVLRNEYVVVSGHPDGLGIREGEVLPGADDNCTATVALIAIGKALVAERPERSVILAWFTGEEKSMNGSHYFINNCPVPVEKISACLNMDMLGRNNTDSLFLVCSDLLSSELDQSIRKVNTASRLNFSFDYRYSNLTNPQQVYFRSDHYPFVRFGVPGVWFFSGFTPDYHSPRDGTESVNYAKFLRTTRLVYLTAYDIGNRKNLLKLDKNPKVTTRGKQNLKEPSLFKYTGS